MSKEKVLQWIGDNGLDGLMDLLNEEVFHVDGPVVDTNQQDEFFREVLTSIYREWGSDLLISDLDDIAQDVVAIKVANLHDKRKVEEFKRSLTNL